MRGFELSRFYLITCAWYVLRPQVMSTNRFHMYHTRNLSKYFGVHDLSKPVFSDFFLEIAISILYLQFINRTYSIKVQKFTPIPSPHARWFLLWLPCFVQVRQNLTVEHFLGCDLSCRCVMF